MMGRNYYIFKEGRIRRSQNTVFLETQEGKRPLPVNDIDQIFIFGEMDLNTAFLNFVGANEIVVHFFNYYGYYTGSFVPRETNISGDLTVRQVQHYIDGSARLFIAKKFVEGAAHNMKRNFEKREGFGEEVEKIGNLAVNIPDCRTINELMSVEAHIKKINYECIEKAASWEFERRTIRPPQNPLNAMISFGNSLVYAHILKEIYETPLNPSISFLHEPFQRRFSLSLDVAEVFKPILVDRLVMRLINLGIITEEHFERSLNFAYLKEEGRKIFVKHFDEMLEERVLHRKLKRRIKYKNLIKLELYKLVKHFLGEKVYSPLKVWW